MNHPMQPTPEPTPEQFADWLVEAVRLTPTGRPGDIAGHVARLAYAAGADAELEACCEWLSRNVARWEIPEALRESRRPKPPSLKEQALSVLPSPGGIAMKHTFNPDDIELIRRAIEALPEEAS